MCDAPFEQSSGAIKASDKLHRCGVALLHHLSFFLIDTLAQLFKRVRHVLLRWVVLFTDFTLSSLETCILKRQVINFSINLKGKFFDSLDDLWVCLSEQTDIMSLMSTMDDTFWADRRRIAVEAEVLNFIFRMFFTEFTHLSVRLVSSRLCTVGLLALTTARIWNLLVSIRLLRYAAREICIIRIPSSYWSFALILSIDFMLHFEELGGAFRIQNRRTLAKFTYDSL